MTSIDDQTATTLATLARFSAALERRDVDGLIAEMGGSQAPTFAEILALIPADKLVVVAT